MIQIQQTPYLFRLTINWYFRSEINRAQTFGVQARKGSDRDAFVKIKEEEGTTKGGIKKNICWFL